MFLLGASVFLKIFLGEREGFWGVVWEGLCGGIFGDGLGWFVRGRGAAPFGEAESRARSARSPPQAGGLRPVSAACRGRRGKQNSHPRRGDGCGDLREVVRQLCFQLPGGGGKDGARVSGEELLRGAAAPCH